VAGRGGVAARWETFHKGGPIHDKPEFAGALLKAAQISGFQKRILVTKPFQFWCATCANRCGRKAPCFRWISRRPDHWWIPKTIRDQRPKQAFGRWEGRVQLFTAQSPEFLNSGPVRRAQTSAAISFSEQPESEYRSITVFGTVCGLPIRPHWGPQADRKRKFDR